MTGRRQPARGWLYVIALVIVLSGCASTRGVYHTVEKGQTLWRISWTYGVDMDYVARVNSIKNTSKIRVGQKIFIPGVNIPRTVLPYAPPPPRPVYSKKPAPSKKPVKVKIGKGRFSWPLKGKVVSKFGMRDGSMHDGIDISAPRGTPVGVSADGEVVFAQSGMRGYGKVVIIKHAGNVYTVYAHNEANLVKAGDRVKKGRTIARVGRSGNATGYHLHFEMRAGGKPENPLFFLP